MRRALFLSALVFFTTSALADEVTDGRNFGRGYCQQTFLCPESMDSESMRSFIPQLIGMANGCVSHHFGRSSKGGFFEESAGLDASGCLSTKNDIQKSSSGLTLMPECCVAPVEGEEGTCRLICDLYGVR